MIMNYKARSEAPSTHLQLIEETSLILPTKFPFEDYLNKNWPNGDVSRCEYSHEYTRMSQYSSKVNAPKSF